MCANLRDVEGTVTTWAPLPPPQGSDARCPLPLIHPLKSKDTWDLPSPLPPNSG